MMVPMAKLEILRSSTIVIKEVFANSPRIRSYRITKSHCQTDSEAPKLVPRACRGRPAIGHDHRVAAIRWHWPSRSGQSGHISAMHSPLAPLTHSRLLPLALSLSRLRRTRAELSAAVAVIAPLSLLTATTMPL